MRNVCSSQLWLCQFAPSTSLPPTPIHVCVCRFTTRFCHASRFTVFVQLLIYLGFLPSFLTRQRQWQTSRNFKCSDSDAVSIFKLPTFQRRSLPPGSGYRYRKDLTDIREDLSVYASLVEVFLYVVCACVWCLRCQKHCLSVQNRCVLPTECRLLISVV
jgi:hypothetical protein